MPKEERNAILLMIGTALALALALALAVAAVGFLPDSPPLEDAFPMRPIYTLRDWEACDWARRQRPDLPIQSFRDQESCDWIARQQRTSLYNTRALPPVLPIPPD